MAGELHVDSEDAAVSAGRLAKSIECYLADHPAAALLEDGRVIFDMRTARYAVSESHGAACCNCGAMSATWSVRSWKCRSARSACA
jgi:hypothetical protein